MRILPGLIMALMVSCSHVQLVKQAPEVLVQALATQLYGPWDGGVGLDALIVNLLPKLQPLIVPSVRSLADENASDNAVLKANARKWLAVKGYR